MKLIITMFLTVFFLTNVSAQYDPMGWDELGMVAKQNKELSPNADQLRN